MKNNYKDLFIISSCFAILGYGIFYNKNLCLAITSGFNIWINNVFPSLFPSVFITNVLVDYNVDYYFYKICKNIKYYIIFLGIICGSINGIIIVKDLYNKNIISLKGANYALMYSYYSSFIFLISMLSLIFDFKYALLIIIISYISNIIVSIPFKINNYVIIPKNNKHNISILLNKTLNILFNILGIICIFNIFASIIFNIFNINSNIIRGILEISQGLFYLSKSNNSILIKTILALFFINFGGLSVHLQIKSILADTSISYKYFLVGRILSFIISICLFILTTCI